MVEDYLADQSGNTFRTYVPVSFGSKLFTPTYLKLSIYAKEILVVHFAFDTFAHILWGSTEPVLVLTDNKSFTSFSKQRPSLLVCGLVPIMSEISTLCWDIFLEKRRPLPINCRVFKLTLTPKFKCVSIRNCLFEKSHLIWVYRYQIIPSTVYVLIVRSL